ncbi:MAG: reductive dehalogenase [Myxococcota bacterium]
MKHGQSQLPILNNAEQGDASPPNPSRRRFVGMSILSAAAGLAAASSAAARRDSDPDEDHAFDDEVELQVRKLGRIDPFDIRSDYKPWSETKVIQKTGPLADHPELIPKMAKFVFPGFDNSQPGYTQKDWALMVGSHSLKFLMSVRPDPYAQHPFDASLLDMKPPDEDPIDAEDSESRKRELPSVLKLLMGDHVYKEQYVFESPKEASNAVKRAARLYGADLVGIVPRDPRFDFDEFYSPTKGKHGWEDIPFQVKTVIMLGFEMDYEGMRAAPYHTGDAATGEGYSQMHKTGYQLQIFLKNLGYHAVYGGNEFGLSVPYAVLAGFGEVGRHGLLINYKYGPRIRLAKVLTDLDVFEFDEPVEFGVQEFCKRCQRCADACPSQAISKEREPSYGPSFEHDGNWFVNPGAKKWYNDLLKCFHFWAENGNGCSSCITSCPYNKPDFWHHRLVDKISATLPGPVHSVMREMDIMFGYGTTFNEADVYEFWDADDKDYSGRPK